MKWLNAVLRYGLILMVVVAIAIAYVYRHQLFPAFFKPQPVEQIAQSSPEASSNSQPGNTASETVTTEQYIASEPEQRDESVTQSTAQKQAVNEDQSGGVVAQQKRADENVTQQERVVDPVTDSRQKEMPMNRSEVMTTPRYEEQMSPGMNGPAMQTPAMTYESPRPPQESSDQVNDVAGGTAGNQQQEADQQQRFFQLLNSARQAYWQNEYGQAVDSYQQALELQPHNPDIYGELGNVYYSQGEWEKAGESFYQAAVRLIKYNRPDRAYYLLPVISGLKKERAAELQQQLNELRQHQNMR